MSLWRAATFVSLAALCLAFLPLVPVRQTASTEVKPAALRNASPAPRLLGEGSATPEAPQGSATTTSRSAGASAAMTLTVPRLGLKDVAVPTGTRQSELDDYGLMRLAQSGVPWRAGSNTYITGHALGYMRTQVPYAFYKLDKMKPGDEVLIKNAGKTYTFRVFDKMTVQPTDTWVTYPTTDGKTIVSLQSCTPIPTFQNRLIVRAELVSVG